MKTHLYVYPNYQACMQALSKKTAELEAAGVDGMVDFSTCVITTDGVRHKFIGIDRLKPAIVGSRFAHVWIDEFARPTAEQEALLRAHTETKT